MERIPKGAYNKEFREEAVKPAIITEGVCGNYWRNIIDKRDIKLRLTFLIDDIY